MTQTTGRHSHILIALFVVATVSILLPAAAVAQCAIPLDWNVGVIDLDEITIGVAAGTSQDFIDELGDAIQRWKSNCSGHGLPFSGEEMPTLKFVGTNSARITVVDETGAVGACGTFIGNQNGGTIKYRGCAGSSIETILAHEIGHALGLDDNHCVGDLMNEDIGSTGYGLPTADHCQVVESWYNTTWEEEQQEGEDPRGGPISPLVFDLNRDGIATTNVATGGVYFDLDGDGYPEEVGWLRALTDDAFLAIDLNMNGRIDGGQELFVNATVLPDGSMARHGWEALVVYDMSIFGGNGDARITAEDGVWDSLWLWRDLNHDGQSTGDELSSLGEYGVTRISLRYSRRNYTDEAGNVHALRGFFFKGRPIGRGMELGVIEDIFFQVRQ